MPGIKRKAPAGLPGPATKKQSSSAASTQEPLETAGMMARAMEDDMIDDDDDDDDDDNEDDEELSADSGENEDDEDMDEGASEDLDDGQTFGGFVDMEAEDAYASGSGSGSDEDEETAGSKAQAQIGRKTEKKKPNAKSLYKPVTNEEMNTLRTEGEVRGGSFEFAMKINAVLSATFLDPLPASASAAYSPSTPPARLSEILKALHSHLTNMPSLPAVSPKRAAERLSPIQIPFVAPSPLSQSSTDKEVKWTLGWEQPKEVYVCGSWGVLGGYRKGRKIGPEIEGKGKGKEVEIGAIDLAVVMPESIFTVKDRLSNRYFHKRAHYMAVIASSLGNLSSGTAAKSAGKQKAPSKSEELDLVWRSISVEWEYAGGDVRRPIIALTVPKNKELGLRHTYTIRILPSLPADVFPLPSLFPGKGNLRVAGAAEDAPNPPSPLYNTSILLDTLHRSYLLHLHRLHKSCPAFRSALALWRIWGDRRGLPSRIGAGNGGVGWSWFGAMVLGFVVDGGEIGGNGQEREVKRPRKGLGRGLSEWQLLRAGWEFLVSTDFAKTPMYMKTSNDFTVPPLEFTRHFKDIFVDPSGTINLFAGWEEGQLALLKQQCRATLETLSDTASDHFDDVFLRPLQADQLTFDEVFRLPLSSISKTETNGLATLEQPSRSARFAGQIADVLRRGLGTRASLVTVRTAGAERWTTKSFAREDSLVTIGISLNKGQAHRILDQGPADGSKAEAAAFRALWGEKAELRRFKDGSITESVVWSVTRPEELALIPGRAVQWLLQRHFGVPESNIDWEGAEFAPLIQVPMSAHRLIYKEGSEREGFRPALMSFEELYKVIKGSDDDLPLSILNFTPTSDCLRYTSTFVPHPVDFSRLQGHSPTNLRYFPVIDVMLQFESSRKWPDDLIAIQKVKMAFLVKLAAVVEAKLPGSAASVVLEADAPDIQDYAALEVVVPKGFAFRLRVYHDRERTLLERMLEDSNITSEKLRRIVQEAYSLHVKRFTCAPRHHAAMANLHHQHPSFATTVRLFKRWFGSHMLSGCLSPEQLELIVAQVFLQPAPFDPPGSAVTGLLRVLDRLATWDWQEVPLYVPIYSVAEEAIKSEQRVTFPAAAHKRAASEFATLRKTDPGYHNGTMIIVTEEDLRGIAWGPSPSRVVAARIVALAKAASSLIKGTGDMDGSGALSVFQTSLSDYDFVIHLDPNGTTTLAQSLSTHSSERGLIKTWEKYLHRGGPTGTVMPGFDPVGMFVQDLKRLFNDNILFFHDSHGGLAIGGLWNPSTAARRNFRPFLGFDTRPVEDEEGSSSSTGMVEINKEGILAEIVRLGTGIVKSVTVNRA